MYCKNCGAEIKDGDLFCAGCGAKAESTAKTDYVSENEGNTKTEKVKKPKKKRKKVLIIIAIIVFIIFAGLFVLMQPKERNMEASELLKGWYDEDELSYYYGDTLNVHGYIVREEERRYLIQNYEKQTEDNVYILTGDAEGTDALFFTYDGDLDENVGTGSELIITGSIGERKDNGNTIFLADNVEVKNEVEPNYPVDSIATLYANKDELMDKKVTVTDGLNEAFAEFILGYGDDIVILNGVTYADAEKVEDYSFTTVTGRLTYKDGYLAIDVEFIK